MPDNFKKIDKDFVLTDESVNVYGFKLKTSGYQIDEYKKIPIGYYDHKDDDGVLVRWDELRIEGDKVLGKPKINLSHPRGNRTVTEIENGFVSSASVGKLVVLEQSTEPHPTESGKTIPVITKWYNRECSIVGLPGNRNANIQMYDEHDNEIQLSDFKKIIHMADIKQIPVEILGSLSLSDPSNVGAATQAIKDLADKAAKADEYKSQLDALKAEKSGFEVKNLLDDAQKEGSVKITNQTRASLEVAFKDKPKELKDLLDNMPIIGTVSDKLQTEVKKDSQEYKDLADKPFDKWLELDLADKAREKYPELFKEKYIAQYGQEKWENSPYAKSIDA